MLALIQDCLWISQLREHEEVAQLARAVCERTRVEANDEHGKLLEAHARLEMLSEQVSLRCWSHSLLPLCPTSWFGVHAHSNMSMREAHFCLACCHSQSQAGSEVIMSVVLSWATR